MQLSPTYLPLFPSYLKIAAVNVIELLYTENIPSTWIEKKDYNKDKFQKQTWIFQKSSQPVRNLFQRFSCLTKMKVWLFEASIVFRGRTWTRQLYLLTSTKSSLYWYVCWLYLPNKISSKKSFIIVADSYISVYISFVKNIWNKFIGKQWWEIPHGKYSNKSPPSILPLSSALSYIYPNHFSELLLLTLIEWTQMRNKCDWQWQRQWKSFFVIICKVIFLKVCFIKILINFQTPLQ